MKDGFDKTIEQLEAEMQATSDFMQGVDENPYKRGSEGFKAYASAMERLQSQQSTSERLAAAMGK